MTEHIRVVLADDHPLVCDGLCARLTSEPDLMLVGVATDGHAVQRLCQELHPDVLLLDLHMPGPSPFETVPWLREHCPETKVLVLTAYDADAYVRRLVAAGVAGYVLKDETTRTVVAAIRAVMAGGTWFSRSVVAKLAAKPDPVECCSDPGLTQREVAVIQLMVRGKTEQEIGQELGIAERTVRYHLHHIYDKLSVNTRVEAAAQAIRLQLVTA